tara:strand:+ start:328 stop:753 length:426 start_codon:yes stop_codon:yes gene_type:complete
MGNIIDKIGVIDDYPFHYEIKTRWKDMDSFGHVNNANYVTYIEDARIIFFKRWNINTHEKSLIVASMTIDYLNQLQHPSDLIIGQEISRLGKKSFDIKSVVFNKDGFKPLAMSTVTCVCYDYKQDKSLLLFPEIVEDYNLP